MQETSEKYKQLLSANALKLVREFAIDNFHIREMDCSSAISDMCIDNNHAHDKWAYEWADTFVTEVFELDVPLKDALESAHTYFDAKIQEWRNNGIIAKDYDVESVFYGVVYHAISIITREIEEHFRLIRDHHYYKSCLFKKTKIVALHHYDDIPLNEFSKKYNRYEVAALLNYVSGKYELSTTQLAELYSKMMSIVYAHPEKKLKNIKLDVERLASSDRVREEYSFLFACAVMEKNK